MHDIANVKLHIGNIGDIARYPQYHMVLYNIRRYCILHLVRGHPRLGSSTVTAVAVIAPAGPVT